MEAILDIQDGSHSIIILLHNVILLIFKNIGLDTNFMIARNLEGSLCGIFSLEVAILTRSQAVARIADHTASQQTLVISDALPIKLHAVNSTSFRLLYRSTIRITPR